MAIGVTLNNVATFQNDTSAVTTVNANSASIVTALGDAVSISGQIPNQMHSNIDMNSNRLINLPAPAAQTEPLRVIDAGTLTAGGTITVQPLPTGGTAAQVLTKNSSTNFDASWAPVVLTGSVNASQLPAFTGDVTTTAGTSATTIATAAVANSKLANMPSYSLKANNTSSSALPTDIQITSIATKASPVGADLVLISDSAAAGAMKSATLSSVATVGSVSSVGGATGVITLGGALSMTSNVLTDGFTTGDIKLTIKTSADTGWLMFADQTIGSASSGATYANANAQALYTLLWNNISSPTANVYAPVTGGLGANAAADFAANKPLLLLKTLGRALALSGSGSALTSRALGSNTGQETDTTTLAQIPTGITSTVSVTASNGSVVSLPTGAPVSSSSTSGSTAFVGFTNTPTISAVASTGTATSNNTGGQAHSLMQPSTFLNAMIKL